MDNIKKVKKECVPRATKPKAKKPEKVYDNYLYLLENQFKTNSFIQ